MRYKLKRRGAINPTMYNRILDECGDCDIRNPADKFVDPALKFFHGIPLMMNTNDRIEERLANGTPCNGMYIKLKDGCHFQKEMWEGYMVNTVMVTEVEYVLCAKETDGKKPPEYFKVEPCESLCQVSIPLLKNKRTEKIRVTHFPLNCNISTTGHKLQGKTLDSLVVNSWAYGHTHWVYVVLSRVKTLKSLIFNEKLNEDREYPANNDLIRWEQRIKDTIERQTFRGRGEGDYNRYLLEEREHQTGIE